MRINVKDYVKQMKESINNCVRPCNKKLLIIQIGNNEASNRYINGKIKDCEDVGYSAVLVKFPEGVSAGPVWTFLKREKEFYHGIILQEPANIDESGSVKKEDIIELISPEQDVDGFKRNSKHNPCTPLGIVNFLKYYLYLNYSFNYDKYYFLCFFITFIVFSSARAKFISSYLISSLLIF